MSGVHTGIRKAFVRALLTIAVGLVGLVLYALGGGQIVYLFFSLVWLVLGSIYLASAVARSRRKR